MPRVLSMLGAVLLVAVIVIGMSGWVPPAVAQPARVPQTGQAICYNSLGNPIDCTGTGQDGDIQAGVTVHGPRFTDQHNGTVRDSLTGLIWLKQGNCFEFVTWDQALSEANTLVSGRCGLSDGSVAGDWRLPNLKELMSLIDYAFPQGTNAPEVFADIGFVYWTSTTLVFDPDQAWIGILQGDYRGIGKALIAGLVWPVRGGQREHRAKARQHLALTDIVHRSCRHQCRHRCRSRPCPPTPRARRCAGICGCWTRFGRSSPAWPLSATWPRASWCRRCCGSG